jgi:hypothetical protein
MKVSTGYDNNVGYEKITIVVDNMPLRKKKKIETFTYHNNFYHKTAACCVCLPRKYIRFMLLIDNNLLLPGAKLHILNNIYRK